MTVLIGLDLSLTSSGICVHDTVLNTWRLYGFAQRKREIGFSTDLVTLFPPVPPSSVCNEERYEHIRHHIMKTILEPLSTDLDSRLVRVLIESYAFAATGSGHSYKLQELGGVIKHAIWKLCPDWTVEVVPPTSWKKAALGMGRATKHDVVQHVVSHGPCVSLLDVLSLDVTKTGGIPCPVQDLADATCLVLSDLSEIRRTKRICL
jgi:Holliday junction resolvasome RuvABC endonuclease subunit